jgi:hypothetical protein
LQKEEEKKEGLEEEERKRREKEKQKTTSVREERIEKKEVSREEGKEAEAQEVLIIPILKLEKPSFETYKLKLNIKVPEIKREEMVVNIPFVKPQEKPSVVVEQKFNDRIVIIEREEILSTIPILRLETLAKAQVIQKFDEEVRKIKEERIEPLIPFYNVERFSLPRYLESLNSNVLTADEITKLKVKSVEELKEKVGTGEAGVPPVGEEEIPDFLEFSFGSEGGKIRRKGPKIILFKDVKKDSYINFLENVCLRVYREIEGGEPEAVKIEKIDHLNKEEIERRLEAGGKIFTINLDEIKEADREEFDKMMKRFDVTHLMERLEETYSSGLGYIIFTTRSEEKFKKMKEDLLNINLMSQGRLNMIFMEARSLPLDLIRLSSGMVDLFKPPGKVIIDEVIPTFSTFDYIFNDALFKEDSRFNKVLEEIKNEENGLFKLATARNKGQEESDLHYNIKVFIVRYLVNRLRKEGKQLRTLEEIIKHIKTEEKSEGKETPDVQVDNEVYEVETLFGEGVDADKKIDETIKKHGGKKVNIVMDNFGFLLHLKDLEKRKRHYKNVEFYTLDLKNKELVSIEEFKKELRKILLSANNKADF